MEKGMGGRSILRRVFEGVASVGMVVGGCCYKSSGYGCCVKIVGVN